MIISALNNAQVASPGILAWAVRVCIEWQHHGLVEPKSVQDATEAYREEMDTVARFLDEECVFGNDETTSKELNDAYGKWCKEHGEEAVSQKQLGTALKKRDLQNKRVAGQRGWKGIGLKVKGSLYLFTETGGVGEAGEDG